MAKKARKQWRDMPPWARVAVMVMVSVQLSLLASALVDISRRPAQQIRGPKPAWAAAAFINFIGPISYFAFGRKAAADPSSPAPQ